MERIKDNIVIFDWGISKEDSTGLSSLINQKRETDGELIFVSVIQKLTQTYVSFVSVNDLMEY